MIPLQSISPFIDSHNLQDSVHVCIHKQIHQIDPSSVHSVITIENPYVVSSILLISYPMKPSVVPLINTSKNTSSLWSEMPTYYPSKVPLVPRLARAVTWPVPAPVARGHHGPLNTSTCPIRGIRDPARMTME